MAKTDYYLLGTRLARGCLGAMARTPLTDSLLVSLFMHKERFTKKYVPGFARDSCLSTKKLTTNLLFISDIG